MPALFERFANPPLQRFRFASARSLLDHAIPTHRRGPDAGHFAQVAAFDRGTRRHLIELLLDIRHRTHHPVHKHSAGHHAAGRTEQSERRELRTGRQISPNARLGKTKPQRAQRFAAGLQRNAIFAHRLAVVAHKLQFNDLAPAVRHVALLARRLAFVRTRRVSQILARIGDNRAVVGTALRANLQQKRLKICALISQISQIEAIAGLSDRTERRTLRPTLGHRVRNVDNRHAQPQQRSHPE